MTATLTPALHAGTPAGRRGPGVTRRRLMAGLGAAAAAPAALAGLVACDPAASPAGPARPAAVSGSVRLGIYGPQAEIPAWEGVVKAFREKQPNVQVEIEHVTTDFQQKLVSLAAADSLWDTMRATDEPFYGNVERGIFRDITDVWNRDLREINPNDFVEGQLDFWRWDRRPRWAAPEPAASTARRAMAAST